VAVPLQFGELAERLCVACRRFGERGWCLATSGNFSARIDGSRCLITQSGRHKSRLSTEDLMICGLDGRPADATCRPSAETPLHTALYELDAGIGAVFHTHSVAATVLSMRARETLEINGFEMQKAISGVTTHESTLSLRVFDNTQDMARLAGRLRETWSSLTVPGFLIAGHGLYAWGKDIDEAERHIEGFEFLFECMLQAGSP
jgi:methylthioribulose-1-phosphate dehydratase